MNRRQLLAAAVSLSCLAAAPSAFGQAWPDKPLRIVVASGAGSSLDALARAIAEPLRERLGQPVIVENKPAAGGTVATAEVAKSTPDGTTMVLGFPGPFAFGPLLQKLPYDVNKDLMPLIITSNQPLILVVNADLPVRTVGELVAWAKANPGKLTYASVGNGSSAHLGMELLKTLTGIDALHVPFNGSPPAVLATVQGETKALLAVMQPVQPQIQAGKLRAIAVTTQKRFFLFPDLPTIAEAGYPNFELQGWNGLMLPAGTPPAIVARLNTEINGILKRPDIVQKMQGLGFELIGGTPEQFGELIRADVARLTPIVKAVGLKVD